VDRIAPRAAEERPMKSAERSKWNLCAYALAAALGTFAAPAQISPSAYRALGQTSLNYNGLNLVQGIELNTPSGIALDTRGAQAHLYIADTANCRVLAWQNVASYQIGDAPTLVLGQPGPQYSGPLGIGVYGFNAPLGVAVDPTTGNLYIADFGDNRVVRYPSPFDNPGATQPDAVYGQPNFATFGAGATSAVSLSQPRAVAVDAAGNLWVADAGNNRVLRFGAAVLNNPAPVAADTVVGQSNFSANLANQGGATSATGLNTPTGLAVDAQNNLYVSDFNNTRVLKFAAPVGANGSGQAASAVWGESDFVSHGVPQQATSSSLAGPAGVAVDASGNLYVAVPHDNRVLMFPPASTSTGAAANGVFGQPDFVTNTANTNAFPQASPNTLSAPTDVKVDGAGNVFIADTANNRVIRIPAGSKSATQVWGQSDFVSNGVNQIKPSSISLPYSMAIDYSQSPYALYVSDTNNNRVLVWKDSVRFQSGDPADLVIGQPNLRTAAPNVDSGTSQKPTSTSLSGPTGIAVDPNGTLYVADAGNNRVLRYPRPVGQQGRITPDAVIGQTGFTTSNSAIVSASSLNAPGGVAIGLNGDLFVADSGNNRVLEYLAGAGTGAVAIRVYGQANMNSALKPSQLSAQTLSSPQGVYVDQASNLYVADSGANRVVVYSNTPVAATSGDPATYIIGQGSFFGAAGGTALKTPTGIGVDGGGQIYVADSGNNRVLIFPSLILLPQAGGVASGVVGQPNLTGFSPNWDGQNGLTSADALSSPVGVYLDRQNTLYVGDAGNNRVLQFLKLGVVVNGATFQAGNPVAPGSIATIGGNALASQTGQATGTTWPTTMVDRQVVFNDQLAAPLYFVGLNQINFQIPSNAALGSNRLAVRLADTGELVAGGSVVVAAASPGLFTSTQNGAGQAAALNQDNTVNGPSNPALAGSTVQLYGTGQGQVTPPVTDGTAAPSQPLSWTVAVPTTDPNACLNSQPSLCVAVGSTGFGGIEYSGLAPGYIGLWQINVTIPKGTPSGNVALRVIIDGAPSNLVTIAVK
jgi:uncharacterized protein (TIGR03437 family)